MTEFGVTSPNTCCQPIMPFIVSGAQVKSEASPRRPSVVSP